MPDFSHNREDYDEIVADALMGLANDPCCGPTGDSNGTNGEPLARIHLRCPHTAGKFDCRNLAPASNSATN